MLGYMGHGDWRDMSEYVVHLTDRDSIQGVFGAGAIEAGATTGVVRKLPELGDSQMSVCLSEIPLGHLDRLADRHGTYGVGFAKRFIESQGGQMVTYLRKDTPGAVRFQALVTAAMRGSIDPNDPLWEITQFYDNPGEYGETRYEFDWEREWRVPRQLRFAENEVVFLLAPEEDDRWMRETAWSRLAASAYQGVVLDPRWNIDRIQQELISNGSGLA
ncbi:abortive phage resistance protein AbiGi (putative antitoxin) [Micromonospora sp. Llam0]|uniref:abortive infection system antitoxin AbiGi family protein n=1 Tax=Micromonospora sp. Llam0 TaxID=2485143 RepID=UPI000F9DFBCB|nr:abortive infection system antitoxin AbiGi family protein [Micromonospora sp. Llam0]ROO51125.1 abortive phage resistance protein AbiGi (putative antitoxin) [Micromonospora sp. Llam0]